METDRYQDQDGKRVQGLDVKFNDRPVVQIGLSFDNVREDTVGKEE